MKRNHFFSADKLPYLLMLLSMMLLIACGGGKKHYADDEDSDEMEEDEEEELADIDEADNEGAALFDLLYDINANADYAYADKALTKNGFQLQKKIMYDEYIKEYVFTYQHPDYGEVEMGWFGAVGFGLTLTVDSEQLAEEVFEQAESRGFKVEEETDYMYSDGKCFIWKNETGFWMYGREETADASSDSGDFKGELGLFELRGPVKQISITSESAPSYEEQHYFDRDGFQTNENGERLADSDWSTYTRDDKGRIEQEDISNGGMEYFEYNANGLLVKHHFERGSHVMTEWYFYNRKGEQTKKTSVFNEQGEDGISSTTYKILSRDSYDNWTERKSIQDGHEDVETRTITYY